MKPNFKDINIKASEKASMTAEEWGQHIEDTFAAIRAELADAAS